MTPTMEFGPDLVPAMIFDRLLILELLFAIAVTALYLKLKPPKPCDVRYRDLISQMDIPNMEFTSGICPIDNRQ
jgi:hypothetical protein